MSKNIVICCDGTGNEYGKHNTNVVNLFTVAERDPDKQIIFYDPGVGTSFNKVKKLMGQAFGRGIRKNIEDAYEYLMDKYMKDDKIFLFGFSRGAFTVRSLAGMLHKCGLLQKGSNNLIEYASKIYSQASKEDANKFKEAFSRPCPVHFIGVWDTVGSLGWITKKTLPNLKLNREVSFGFHALAIDEKRKKFPASLWREENIHEGQTIEQVWFVGVHSDVGGWYDERELSNIALQWMIDKAVACGLILDDQKAKTFKGDPDGMMHESYKGFWRLWRPVIRPIPEESKIHTSVIARMRNKGKNYNPSNLPDSYEEVQ